MNQPPPSLLTRRTSGVLLHITSLPSPHGSGDFGAGARHFIDWLAAAGQSLWQILPLNPAGPGHSPYQSVSAFAGDPGLIDLQELVERGWLAWQPDLGFDRHRCDFARVTPYRMGCLRQAWNGFCAQADARNHEDLAHFGREHAHWLDDYALFMVLHEQHGAPWSQWPTDLASRDPSALAHTRELFAHDLGFWRFVQWRFWMQWQALRQRAHERGVHIAGDAPIFVAHHSADVWAHAHEFLLDDTHNPTVVAGVPPDYFSATGQRWGNPLYNWAAMARSGHRWWKDRLAHLFKLVDVVRLDHFRGFESHWEIPASEPTAVAGRWQTGPGMALFEALQAELGSLAVIAEDLGLITEAVTHLRDQCGYPGMRILHFALGSGPANPYLPHNFLKHTVAYTGTHDNNTTVGWWQQATASEKADALTYFGPAMETEPHWTMIRALSASVANTLVIPFQDVLGLDGEHRMNTPGHATGCWEWRFDWDQVDHSPATRLHAMAVVHGRLPPNH